MKRNYTKPYFSYKIKDDNTVIFLFNIQKKHENNHILNLKHIYRNVVLVLFYFVFFFNDRLECENRYYNHIKLHFLRFI